MNNEKLKIIKENEDKFNELQNVYNSLTNEIQKFKNKSIINQNQYTSLQNQNIQIEIAR
jgi:uncharacterized protein YdcH (DUF465 family)